MRTDRLIHVVSAHAEGEVGDVVTGGVAPPPGETLWEQRDHLARDGRLRRFLLNEPRGGVFRHVNLIVPPRAPEAAWGFLIMEPEHTPPMSGSNTICVATVLLETGMVPITGPETRFVIEAPAGPIAVTARCENGKARDIRFRGVASFADRLDAPLDVPGLGRLTVDTAYGGDSFVIVRAEEAGLELVPERADEIAALGARITRAANAQLGFAHPAAPWRHISFCQFTAPVADGPDGPEGLSAVVIDPGKVDRSPTGTGCAARMAVMAARGAMGPGDRFTGRAMLGGRFECRIAEETEVAGRPAIIPEIRGRAWITGTHQLMRDPDDPWPEGYRMTDTWPRMP